MTWLISLFFFAFSVSAFPADDAAPWHRLVHYRSSLTGAWKSQVVSPDFFFAPDGRTTPESELKATVLALQENTQKRGALALSPRCTFPARARYVREQLKIPLPPTPCPEYEDWVKSLGAQRISLIYSTAYANNPASMFGHTFLKIAGNGRNELLDYGVNFAAAVGPGESALKYIFKGIFGGYEGIFSLAPYYQKVNEYNHSESRDLWEYELDFTAEERTRFLEHLWELRMTALFEYYFFDDNCSYQVLALLEVARPDWPLTSRFHSFVLPSDTLRAVTEISGSVRDIRYRPSNRKRLLASRDALSPEERGLFAAVLAHELRPASVRSLGTLEALLAFFEYRRARAPADFETDWGPVFRETLAARAAFPTLDGKTPPGEVNGVRPSRPDLSHGSSRISFLGGRAGADRPWVGLELRPGVHDLLDDDTGVEPFSQIEGLALSIGYFTEQKEVRLNELRIAELTSLHPWDSLDPKFSWEFAVKIDRVREEATLDSHRARAEVGAGMSFSPPTRKAAAFVLLLATADGSKSYRNSVKAGPELHFGGALQFLTQIKGLISWRMRVDLLGLAARPVSNRLDAGLSWSFSREWQTRATGAIFPRGTLGLRNEWESTLSIAHYF